MKRVFDLCVSLTILLLFLPFGMIISILIALESRGGIFYRQKRVGRNGNEFNLLKFRTMKPNSDRLGQLTVGMRDPRITRIGYFLRKTKLDEFPQFINVLKGEMSIVGPRPEVKAYVDFYNENQRKILQVKPGITDYASLEYFDENRLLGEASDPHEMYIREIMPAKLKLNEKYLENPSVWKDIHVMWSTFKKMLR